MISQLPVCEESAKTVNSLTKSDENSTSFQKNNKSSKGNKHRKLILLP